MKLDVNFITTHIATVGATMRAATWILTLVEWVGIVFQDAIFVAAQLDVPP
jgi:hypothetical protein